MKKMFLFIIKRMFTLSVMVMEVAKPMITVILHMSLTRKDNLTVDIVFMKSNALGRSTCQ